MKERPTKDSESYKEILKKMQLNSIAFAAPDMTEQHLNEILTVMSETNDDFQRMKLLEERYAWKPDAAALIAAFDAIESCKEWAIVQAEEAWVKDNNITVSIKPGDVVKYKNEDCIVKYIMTERARMFLISQKTGDLLYPIPTEEVTV